MSIIQAHNLSKKYNLGNISQQSFFQKIGNPFFKRKGSFVNDSEDIFWALKDVSFSIEQGQVTGIIGKNGAGKSTLLKILSNIVAPTTGTVKIKGRVSSLLEVGTGFHPELTGRENIYLNGSILGMNRFEIKEKFDSIVDFSGVENFIDTPVKRYSSGMYVRLAFSVAAFLEPEILILDEVLAVGDGEFQKKCIEKMSSVAKNGQTILFVSHSISSIQSLCGTCLYFNKGKLLSHGDTRTIVESYMKNQEAKLDIIGTRIARLIDFKALNISGKESNFFTLHETVRFRLTYESIQVLSNVTISISLNSIFGDRVTSYWSEYNKEYFEIQKGINEFEIIVDKIKVIPGQYSILAYIGTSGNVIEEVINLSTLTVGINPIHNTIIPVKELGMFVDKFSTIKLNPFKPDI